MKLLISVITVILLAAGHVSAQAKSFLWEVKTDKAVVYLLGSIHMATKGMYPLDGAIEQAFNASDKLVVEVNIAESDKVNVQNILLNKAIYKGGETLNDNLSDKTKSLLQAFLQEHQLSYFSIAKLNPAMAAISLTIMRMMQLGFSPELGIDLHFINKAQDLNKPILQLESEEEQLNLLLNIPNKELFLHYTLTSLSDLGNMVNELVGAWESGDTEKMNKLMLEEPLHDYPDFEPLFKQLFTDRNIKMTKKIKNYLKTNQTYFVVAGAGHMVGEQGIVALLEKAGYVVKQL